MSFQTGTRMSYLNWGKGFFKYFSNSKHGKIHGYLEMLYLCTCCNQLGNTAHTSFPWDNQLYYKILLQSELDIKTC